MSDPFSDILDRLQEVISSITAGGDFNYDWPLKNINTEQQAGWDKTKPACMIYRGEDETNSDRFPSDFHSENVITPIRVRIFNFMPTISESRPNFDVRRPLLQARSDIINTLERNRTLKDENNDIYCEYIKFISSEFVDKKNNNVVSPKWLDVIFEIWWGYIRGQANQSAYK